MNMKAEIKQAIASTAKQAGIADKLHSIQAQQFAQATLNLANALATIEEIERRKESAKESAKTEEQKSGGYANAARHRMHELVLNQPKREFWHSAFATMNEGRIHSLVFDETPHESREEAFKRVQGTDTGVVAQVTLFSGTNPNQGPPSDQ